MNPISLPMAGVPEPEPIDIPALQDEVRALAAERGAVILAHNYQVPEVQDVADYVGDSLGLSQTAAAVDEPRDRLLRRALHGRDGVDPLPGQDRAAARPRRRLLARRLDHRRPSCAAWQAEHPGAITVMYVNTTAEIKAITDYCCTSSNAVNVVEHILREHGPDTEILFGPDMFLGAYVEKTTGHKLHVWSGECHVHAGIRPKDIADVRAAHPGSDFLIHPECGCVDLGHGVRRRRRRRRRGRPHALDRRDARLRRARAPSAPPGTDVIVATETGMLHPMRMAAPDVDFIAANEAATCRYMKMITLPKLRDALRDGTRRGQGPRGPRRQGAHPDRADGRDQRVTPPVAPGERDRGCVEGRPAVR